MWADMSVSSRGMKLESIKCVCVWGGGGKTRSRRCRIYKRLKNASLESDIPVQRDVKDKQQITIEEDTV